MASQGLDCFSLFAAVVGIAQLVEHLVVVQDVAGSSPVTHPIWNLSLTVSAGYVRAPSRERYGLAPHCPNSCPRGSDPTMRCHSVHPTAVSVLEMSRRWQRHGIGSPHMMTVRR